ncbi:beta-galactosidase [Lachnoclostridium sp. Marseille-P6806]|uniref:beta-galactosidase n=1 Tax=Lachnoclostridium sp. Marseille-P6806 TaxID=2364793 RepID=UPI001030B857|nr:beta-galactosidase [Lachnoclostridium sp. Marseille-P6806]
MSYEKRPYILFGGDYNPDQWDERTIAQDMKYFREAHINTVILPVFSWASLEPSEGQYEFGRLDHILDVLEENRLHYILATPTSAQPAWMSRKYPEVLPVDIAGRKRTHGMRVFFCVNSEKYRERAAAVAARMAERYGGRKGLSGWHIANEYGTSCYCDTCQRRFREWVRERYGTIEEVNTRWHTSFWGRTLTSFEEIMLPTELNDDYRFYPAVELDYQRFKTDSTIECFENEYRIVKAASPKLPVFTNISGYLKKLDQFAMVPHMDVAGWDNYPGPRDPRSLPALKHDIMRAAKDGESYYVAEQSPAQQNWQPYNKLKRPGELRRLAYQGLAHGSDSSLYFQMRQSVAGQEKLHGAIISRVGSDTTRTFREAAQLGSELEKLGARFVGGRTAAEVGLLFDWDSWRAAELCSGPTKDLDYLEDVRRFYEPFYIRNVPVDILKSSASFDRYRIIVAPLLYMMKGDAAERLERFVRDGGTLVTTYMSGYADENDRCVFGACPGPLRRVTGVWVEETDALYPDECNALRWTDGDSPASYPCDLLCDLVHLDGARAIAVYEKDFYAGMPAVTEHAWGDGKAYYVATRPSAEFLSFFAGRLLASAGVRPVLASSGQLEITRRDREGVSTWFVISFDEAEGYVELGGEDFRNLLTGETLRGRTAVAPGDVLVLGRDAPAERKI